MKKFCSSIVIASIILFNCKSFSGPAEDMLAAAQPTMEGLIEMADKAKNKPAADEKKKPTLDPVAYEALVLAHKGVTPNANDFLKLDSKAPAVKALIEIKKKYNLPSCDSFIDRVLANADPSVRAKAVTMLGGGLFGTSTNNRAKIKALIAKEDADPVIAAIIYTFANDGDKEPEIGKFLVKGLSSENPAIRKTVAVFSTSSWNAKNDELAKKLAELILTEKDAKVRESILERAGSLDKDVIFESYNKVLDSDASADVKAKALTGILKMWWSFPLYNTHNEKAYKKTLAYIPQIKDEAANKKLFSALFSALSSKSSIKKTQDEYAKKAPWYVADDVKKILLPLVDYKVFNAMDRTRLFKAIYAHGATKEEVTALVQKFIDAATSNFDKGQYENLLKSLK